MFTTFLPGLLAGRPLSERLRLSAVMLTRGRRIGVESTTAACEVGRDAARRLGLSTEVQHSLYRSYEWWNGKGVPDGLEGTDDNDRRNGNDDPVFGRDRDRVVHQRRRATAGPRPRRAGRPRTVGRAASPPEPHFTVHAMDRRGRGASGDADAYDDEREFEDVAAVVDAVASTTGAPVDVYGHSGGARFALGAATLTTNLRRLVLYETALDPGALLPDGLLERVDELLAAGDPDAVVETFFCEVLHMDDEAVATYRAQPSWAARVATAHTLPRELRIPPERMFDRHRAAQVSVPVLLFQGSTTPAGLKSALTELAATLPEARVIDLDGQGHTADVLAPELVAAELAAFLR